MIRLHITNATGTLAIGDQSWVVLQWRRLVPDDPGATRGITDCGQNITLGLSDKAEDGTRGGSLTLGNTNDAAIWTLRELRFDGGVMTGLAYAVPSDVEHEALIDRLAARMRG